MTSYIYVLLPRIGSKVPRLDWHAPVHSFLGTETSKTSKNNKKKWWSNGSFEGLGELQNRSKTVRNRQIFTVKSIQGTTAADKKRTKIVNLTHRFENQLNGIHDILQYLNCVLIGE
jgi:hypothetical protein